MRSRHIGRKALAGPVLLCTVLLGGMLVAAPVGGPLAALNVIEPGEWQLREAGTATGTAALLLCVADPQMLLQVQHRGVRCSRFIVDDLPHMATVHYTCPSAGHGRTTVTVESASSVHVQTQGIAGGAPFDFDYQARRMGPCSGGR